MHPPKPQTKVNARLPPPLNNPHSKAVQHYAATADYTDQGQRTPAPHLDPSHGKAVQHYDP
ncbi:hypothetical protein [Streptomyces canus]|uniref:hypothetical protein n=1 Tax=Streptomyces canus TaxID=58343 RepID=UPI00074A57CE|nr:hypothetical protein [Streptomyces canus]KUN12559.1 hypothetical protein AQI96_15325 [Streptomyces canus]